MSGHSKWSKVKHQKATTDVVKSAEFTKASHAITVAVKEGGGMTDPTSNFHLRLAIEKARAVNMPKENIQRAIAHAASGSGSGIEQIMYEGYAPGGVALLIESTTDNRQRTVSQIKNILERAGGTLAQPGAVGYQFVRRGVLTVEKSGSAPDTLMAAAIETGADDVVDTLDLYEIYTKATELFHVKKLLEQKGIVIDNAVLIMHPTITVEADGERRARTEELIRVLEELDDVQTVYSNLK